MINPRRQHQQITTPDPNPHPPLLRITDIEKARSLQDVANLFIFMHVLVVEHFDFLFVGSAHGAAGDGDFVAVGVVAAFGEGVEVGGGGGGGGREGVVEDAEGGEVGGGECDVGVVREAAVALILCIVSFGCVRS